MDPSALTILSHFSACGLMCFAKRNCVNPPKYYLHVSHWQMLNILIFAVFKMPSNVPGSSTVFYPVGLVFYESWLVCTSFQTRLSLFFTLKSNLTKQQNGFKITLKTLEDNLLSRLSSASGNFLGDIELVENLETTKRTAADIEDKVRYILFSTLGVKYLQCFPNCEP